MNKWSKDDIRKVEITTISLCLVVLFAALLGRVGIILHGLGRFVKALSPLIWGCVIAFLLSPLMNAFRKGTDKLFKAIMKKSEESKVKKVANITAVILTLLSFFTFFGALLWILIPELRDSIVSLYDKIPEYYQNIQAWLSKILKNNPDVYNIVNANLENAQNALTTLINEKILPNMDTIILKISSGIWGGLKMVFNFAVGIIIAVYILAAKDTLAAQGKKITYSIFDKKRGNKVLDALDFTNSVFSGFINGKIIDSIIIGILAAIFLTSVNMPYAALISVVIGITNIIPFFGPFIGGIPCGILVLVDDPLMCIVFVIFILVLQQLDGNIIGPLIIGDSTGLSGLWVMLAILVGGDLFGFAGMLLGVPVFACIYTLFTIFLRERLKKKGLRNNTEDFMNLRRFDTKTGKPIYGPKPKRVSMKKRKKMMKAAQESKEKIMKILHHDDPNKKENTDAENTEAKEAEVNAEDIKETASVAEENANEVKKATVDNTTETKEESNN